MNCRKYFLAWVLLSLSPSLAWTGMRPVPVDAVMAEGELFFVMEEPKKVISVSVTLHLSPLEMIAEAKKKSGKRDLTMWTAESPGRRDGRERKRPELSQIRYARESPGLATTAGPVELRRNVTYKVRIEIEGGEFASEIFFIDDKGGAVMPKPTFSRQKGRGYSVLKDKDGNRVLVPSGKE